MRIVSSRFGPVEVDGNTLLRFPRGLVGFPQWRRFVLMPEVLKPPFQVLQSADEPDLALVVIDPRAVEPGYVAAVRAEALAGLGIRTQRQAEQARVLGLVTLGRDPAAATVNLRAPLVINPHLRLGAQVILEDDRYSIRHPLLPPRLSPAPAAGQEASGPAAAVAVVPAAGRP